MGRLWIGMSMMRKKLEGTGKRARSRPGRDRCIVPLRELTILTVGDHRSLRSSVMLAAAETKGSEVSPISLQTLFMAAVISFGA